MLHIAAGAAFMDIIVGCLCEPQSGIKLAACQESGVRGDGSNRQHHHGCIERPILGVPCAHAHREDHAQRALLWGIAADFHPGRRLFLIAALLLLPAAGYLWVADGRPSFAIGVLAFWLVRGGLVCLPWVLMAEVLPARHFAKIALGIMFVGGVLGGAAGPLSLGLSLHIWGINAFFWVVLVEGIAVAVVASRLPGPQAAAAASRRRPGVCG